MYFIFKIITENIYKTSFIFLFLLKYSFLQFHLYLLFSRYLFLYVIPNNITFCMHKTFFFLFFNGFTSFTIAAYYVTFLKMEILYFRTYTLALPLAPSYPNSYPHLSLPITHTHTRTYFISIISVVAFSFLLNVYPLSLQFTYFRF